MTRIDQVLPGIFRIATFEPKFGTSMNQFLIADEHPALIHTGTHPAYEAVRKAVSEVIDPKTLRYVVVPHFEADECGGMGRFVKEAPDAVLVCSDAGQIINLSAWDYSGPVKGVREGDVIELGKHSLTFIETPHVHHWYSMMAFEGAAGACFRQTCLSSRASSRR
jgi:flavorubredoxin